MPKHTEAYYLKLIADVEKWGTSANTAPTTRMRSLVKAVFQGRPRREDLRLLDAGTLLYELSRQLARERANTSALSNELSAASHRLQFARHNPPAREPEKKTARQLDREIDEVLAKGPGKVGYGLSAIDEDEWSWSVERLRKDQTTWGSGSDTLAGGVEYSKAEAVAKIKETLAGLGVALTDAVRLPF